MQSMQIVLTRDDQSVPWGFRLKGGAEYNVPLSILKVNPGSPACTKLNCTDIVQSIGNYSALYLKHEEALNIIRLFEYHLPLVIKRESVTENNNNPNNSLFWAPSQAVQNHGPRTTPKNSTNFDTCFTHNLSAGPAWPQQHNHDAPHQQVFVDNQDHKHLNDERSNDFKSQYNYQPIFQQTFPIGLPQVPDYHFSSQARQPPPLFNYNKAPNPRDGAPPLIVPPPLIRAMTGSSMGKKPFTYTPGGLDLSHIRESPRVKRYDNYANKGFEVRPQEQHQTRAYTPSFIDENGDTLISAESAYSKNRLKQAHYNEPQFGGVSSEHLVKPNKHKELINQSTSFRMLNRWIQEAESHPDQHQPEPEQRRHTEKIIENSKVLRCLTDADIRSHPESGVDRTSYVKQNAPLSPYTRLLKLKAQVDKSLGKSTKKPSAGIRNIQIPLKVVDNENKVPAGLRYQEREVNKFLGENIPSKTFKYLQYITQEEQALMDQERKHRIQMQHQQQPVSSYPIHNVQSSKPHQTKAYVPKPIMNPPISFHNSPLNVDRPKVNLISNSTSYNARKINTYFDHTGNSSNKPQPNYPFAHEIKFEPPKYDYPDFNNNPSDKKEQVASMPEEEVKDSNVECSFLPSESSFNETNITFNSISPADQTHTEVVDIKSVEEVVEIIESQEAAVADEISRTEVVVIASEPEQVEAVAEPEQAIQEPEAPVTEAPVTEAPVAETPAVEEPATEAPATEAPATEAPATEAPVEQVKQEEAVIEELVVEPETPAPVQAEPVAEVPVAEEPVVTETPVSSESVEQVTDVVESAPVEAVPVVESNGDCSEF